MKAMLLAAGKGTRVRPITNSIPKPMIPIIRKPVMQSIIELLKQHQVNDIVVNTSHLASSIEDYFRDGEPLGVNLAYSYEGYIEDGQMHGKALGSAGGMKKIQEFSGFFDETFIVLCGDAWIDLDITRALQYHREKGGVATIILQEVAPEEVYKYGVVALNDDGQITEFQEKPTPEEAVSNLINTGIYIFEPEIFEHIPAGMEYDIGGELFPSLVAQNIPFYGVSMDFQWVDIGSIPDVWTATRDVLSGKVEGYQLPGREVAPGVYAGINVKANWDKIAIQGPVYIGSSTEIQDGTTIIGPTVIGSNCLIQRGALIEHCIIEDYTRIAGIARLDNKIIFGNQCIDPFGEVMDVKETGIDWIINDIRQQAGLAELYKAMDFYGMLSSVSRENGSDVARVA
jgi:mannose-1-phosphate guanylyltransferase